MATPDKSDRQEEDVSETASLHVPRLDGGLGGGPIGSPGSLKGRKVTGPSAGDAAPDLGIWAHESGASGVGGVGGAGDAGPEGGIAGGGTPEDQDHLWVGGPTGPDASMPTPGGISEGTMRDAAGILGTDPHAEDMPGEATESEPPEDQAA
jgi:hypothetical protein